MIFGSVYRRSGLLFAFMLMALSLSPIGNAGAAELVIFESTACEWCETWNEEIGVVYDKTSEAKIVPLRRVDMDDELPADLKNIDGLMYTPTFVVLDDGREVGRIVGYPGEDFFWQLLNEIIKKI